MIFYVSFYDLVPQLSLGRLAAQRIRKGALLKIQFKKGVTGYSDCHPWPELGDLPLLDQLELLKKGSLTSLTERSVTLARLDAEARGQRQSLWEGLEIPPSHALVTDPSRLTESSIEALAQAGFTRIKIKVGYDWREEACLLASFFPQLRCLGMKVRLDLNCALNAEQLALFLDTLGPMIEGLDFIEDPTPYDPLLWLKIQKDWKVRLAFDQMREEYRGELREGSFSVLILKPAIQKPEVALQMAKKFKVALVVTTYLDHPLGQFGAAWTAAGISHSSEIEMEPCGLFSHSVYQPNVFSSQISSKGPRLLPPGGTGLGWDTQLESLNWQEWI